MTNTDEKIAGKPRKFGCSQWKSLKSQKQKFVTAKDKKSAIRKIEPSRNLHAARYV